MDEFSKLVDDKNIVDFQKKKINKNIRIVFIESIFLFIVSLLGGLCLTRVMFLNKEAIFYMFSYRISDIDTFNLCFNIFD